MANAEIERLRALLESQETLTSVTETPSPDGLVGVFVTVQLGLRTCHLSQKTTSAQNSSEDDDDDDDDDINLRPGNLSSNLPKGIGTC